MNVVITGSNGMIGNLILQKCLHADQVNELTSFSRKSLQMTHPKLKEIIVNDFSNLEPYDESFKNIDLCFYCLGVYTGQVPEDEFIKITVDYPALFAKKLREKNPSMRFILLSGQGADPSETSSLLFAKQKGRIENILLNLQFKAIHFFRPGYIYPVTPREEPNLMYRLMRILYKPISFIYPNIGLTSVQLAEKMFEVGVHGGDKIIFENKDIK